MDIIAVQLWLVCRLTLRHWPEVTALIYHIPEGKERTGFPFNERKSSDRKIQTSWNFSI